ncbi:hypothetical protein O6H91_13G081900 [Diphasiastrum complanatum]|uniref:Uncharacterized protein n=1 Tax=Diphasiastrum complanatum TaxID=34168 RepID=A0ACC2BWQ6_DIPCM|nr:hypothetical protein O6H91_13G081900 [Diphasiastrum complanatum]
MGSKSSVAIPPQLVKLLEADDNQKVRSHSYYVFNRSTMRHMSLLKTLCLFLFLLITAGYFAIKPLPSFGSHHDLQCSSAAWEKAVRKSAQRKEGGRLVVLLTGAAGFVGSHVSLALKDRGDGVVGLDNFNHYYPVALKRARAAKMKKAGIFTVEGDLNDQKVIARLFSTVTFTHVLHLAAQAGVRYAVHNPLAYVHSNVGGFVTLLEQCKNTVPQPAFVYASSSSVYGLNSKVPFSEDDRTDHPASLYAATKKADEVLAHTYNHIYGLSITALRFFTVYGPWGRPDMAYFSFTKNIIEGRPIKIFQGPNHEELARDFTFIDDIVKGCVSSLDTATPSTGSRGKKRGKAQFRIFNLGNTQPVPVGRFVSILEKHLKKKAIREIVPMPSTGDVMFTHANITKAQRALGYNPQTDLETGLKHFVKWYQTYYAKGSGHEDTLKGYMPF